MSLQKLLKRNTSKIFPLQYPQYQVTKMSEPRSIVCSYFRKTWKMSEDLRQIDIKEMATMVSEDLSLRVTKMEVWRACQKVFGLSVDANFFCGSNGHRPAPGVSPMGCVVGMRRLTAQEMAKDCNTLLVAPGKYEFREVAEGATFQRPGVVESMLLVTSSVVFWIQGTKLASAVLIQPFDMGPAGTGASLWMLGSVVQNNWSGSNGGRLGGL